MNENIRPVIATDESEPFCVVEPLYFTFYSRHVPYSGRLPETRLPVVPADRFSSLGFATAFWEGRGDMGSFTFSPDVLHVLYPLLWLWGYCALYGRGVSTKTKHLNSNGLQRKVSAKQTNTFIDCRPPSIITFNGERFSSPATTATKWS